MKTLITLAIILAIFATYFMYNIEKSVFVKNADSVTPAGIDIAKTFLNKIRKINSEVINKINNGGIPQPGLSEKVKSKIEEIGSKISDKTINLIKKPVEDKMVELFCPQK